MEREKIVRIRFAWNKILNALITIFFCIMLTLYSDSSIWADRRNYVWTYQYLTMPKGETELEFYQTTKLRVFDEWEYRIEIEHGLTNHWDFSVYQIFKQREKESFLWEAVQFRSRYRFGEEGQYVLDPLVYIEYNRNLDLKKQNKLEAKVILAKTISKFNCAVNPVYEYSFAPGTNKEAGVDVGLSWEFHPVFIIGIESTSRIEPARGEKEVASYFGPTISLASGKWWYSLGVGFGVTEDSDDARIRFLMGILF